MNLKIADGMILFGGSTISISTILNLFTVNEWVVLGIIVGILCSAIGSISALVIRVLWLRAKIRILKESISIRDANGKPPSAVESILLDSDDQG